MKAPGIRITRYPYEEPHHLNLRITASNGRIVGDLEYYCNATDLGVLGRQLAGFSGKRSEEIVYELGSEKPEDRFAFLFSLRVKPLDSVGHCAVIVRLSNNGTVPEKEVSEFAIKAEVADVNRLGRLFEEFGRLEHRVLDWRVHDGRLIKDEEAA
jgi:hypothetical protein